MGSWGESETQKPRQHGQLNGQYLHVSQYGSTILWTGLLVRLSTSLREYIPVEGSHFVVTH